MGKEPELKIKVKVDPQINAANTKASIEKQFKKDGVKLPNVPVEIDSDEVKKKLENDLKNVPITFDPDIKSSELKQKIEDHFSKKSNKPKVSIDLAENNIRNDIKTVIESEPFNVDIKADYAKFENDYKTNIDRIKKETNLTVDINLNDFDTELSLKLKEQLKKVNSDLSYYLKTLTNKSDSLNQVANSLYIDTDISKKLSDQTNEVRSELDAFKKELLDFGSLSDIFENNSDFLDFDDFLRKFNNFQSELTSIVTGKHEVAKAGASPDFIKRTFESLKPEAEKYLGILDELYKKLKSNHFLKANGINNITAHSWMSDIEGFKKILSKTITYTNKKIFSEDTFADNFYDKITKNEILSSESILNSLEDFNEELNEGAEKLSNIEKRVKSTRAKSTKDVIGGYDESRIDKINEKYSNVLNHFIDLQEKLNIKKEDTVYFDEILLSNSTEQVSELIKMAKEIDATYKNISAAVHPEKPKDDDSKDPPPPSDSPSPPDPKRDQKTSTTPSDIKSTHKDSENKSPVTAVVDSNKPSTKNSEEIFTNYSAVINNVIFNIEKETLQNKVNDLFKDVSVSIDVSPSENSINSVKQAIQTGLQQLSVDVTQIDSKTENTVPLTGSITVDADHITSPTDPIPLIGKINVPSTNITVDGKAIPDVVIDQKPKKTSSKTKKQVEDQISFDDISTEQLEAAAEKAAESMKPILLPGSIRIKKEDVTVNDFKVSLPGKVHLKKEDVITNNFKVDLPGKIIIKSEDVATPDKPIDIPVNAVISKKDDAGIIPSLNGEVTNASNIGEKLTEASKMVSDYRDELESIGTTSQYATQQVDLLNHALGKQIKDFDKLDEKIKKYLENLEKLNPVELKGKITVGLKDVIVPKKITLNGDLLIANATKEIKAAEKKAAQGKKSKEDGNDSKKEKKKKAKTPEELQKEYLISFSGLYKKIMRTMNARDKSAGKIYDGTYVEDLDSFLSGGEFDSYLADLTDRLKTTVKLLNKVNPSGDWKNDAIYTSAIKDGQHERKNYLFTESDKADLKKAKKEQEEYLDALRQLPTLQSDAFTQTNQYGATSENYRKAADALNNAQTIIAAYESQHSKKFIESIPEYRSILNGQASDARSSAEKEVIDNLIKNYTELQKLYKNRAPLFSDKDVDKLKKVDTDIQKIEQSVNQLITTAKNGNIDLDNVPAIIDARASLKSEIDASNNVFNTGLSYEEQATYLDALKKQIILQQELTQTEAKFGQYSANWIKVAEDLTYVNQLVSNFESNSDKVFLANWADRISILNGDVFKIDEEQKIYDEEEKSLQRLVDLTVKLAKAKASASKNPASAVLKNDVINLQNEKNTIETLLNGSKYHKNWAKNSDIVAANSRATDIESDIKASESKTSELAEQAALLLQIESKFSSIKKLFKTRESFYESKDKQNLDDVNKLISTNCDLLDDLLDKYAAVGGSLNNSKIVSGVNNFKKQMESSDSNLEKNLANKIEREKKAYIEIIKKIDSLSKEESSKAKDGLSQLSIKNLESEIKKAKSDKLDIERFLKSVLGSQEFSNFEKTEVNPIQDSVTRSNERRTNTELEKSAASIVKTISNLTVDLAEIEVKINKAKSDKDFNEYNQLKEKRREKTIERDSLINDFKSQFSGKNFKAFDGYKNALEKASDIKKAGSKSLNKEIQNVYDKKTKEIKDQIISEIKAIEVKRANLLSINGTQDDKLEKEIEKSIVDSQNAIKKGKRKLKNRNAVAEFAEIKAFESNLDLSKRTSQESQKLNAGKKAEKKTLDDLFNDVLSDIDQYWADKARLDKATETQMRQDIENNIKKTGAKLKTNKKKLNKLGLEQSRWDKIHQKEGNRRKDYEISKKNADNSKKVKDDAKQAQKDKKLQNEIEAKKSEYLKLLDERNKLLTEQAKAAEDGISQQETIKLAEDIQKKQAELDQTKKFLVNNIPGGDWNDFEKQKVNPKRNAFSRAEERQINKDIAAEEKKKADDLAKKAKEAESYVKKYEQSVDRYLKAKEEFDNADNLADWYKSRNEYENALENMTSLEDYITGQSSIIDNAEYLDRYKKASKKAVLGENALAEALRDREEAQRAAIATNDEDLKSLNQFIAQVENMQGALEKNLATNTPEYSSLLSLGNKGKSLFQFLDANPTDKNFAAQRWGRTVGYADIKTLEDAFAKLRKEAAEAKIPVQEIRTDVEKLTKMTRNKTRVANLLSELNDYLEKFPKVGSSLADEVRELQKALSDPGAWKNAGELGLKMADLRKHAKELGLESENLYDKFKKLFGQHLGTAIVMGALHKMQEAARVIYQNVVNIDTAMTELRKVTSMTSEEYSKFAERAVQSASDLGVSVSEFINSTADWARLGYDDEEAERLATYTNLLRNVGDGIDDVNTASSYLISTLQGFKIDSSEIEHVVDVINSVANTQPITAEGIGEVLSRSSAAMSAAGNTLEQTIALGVAANAVVQDSDSVGTAMKSLSMYLRAAKSELEDAGEATDGCANSVSELRSELKSLTGVDIMLDAAGTQFKSTYQIMKELSNVWDTLSDVTKANVTEMIAGKRNANIVTALLEGFDTAESALASATSNVTSAWAENEIYLDSIQGKISQLDAAFQSLSTHILDSEVPKFFISVATAITKGVDALIKFNGAIPSLTFLGTMATQLGRPKMTGFMIVPSNTLVVTRNERTKSVREYLAKPTNMVILDCEFG